MHTNRFKIFLLSNWAAYFSICIYSLGFIHGDFTDHNILAQKEVSGEEALYHVDGILDFEDLHHGTYIWDIGLMLAHSMLTPQGFSPVHAAGYTLAGYLSLRTLTDLEMSLLKVWVLLLRVIKIY